MTNHPDVVPYACDDERLTVAEIADIDEHLHSCADCRDLVLFIQKVNQDLGYERGVKHWEETRNIEKVLERNDWDRAKAAKALGMSFETLLARIENSGYLRRIMASKLKTVSDGKTTRNS